MGLLDIFKKKQKTLKEDMFPDKLDNANVIFYTEKGDYGTVDYTDGRIYQHVKYLEICFYSNDSGYYLFLCNDEYDVIQDDLCDSIEQCKQLAHCRKKDIIWKEIKLMKYFITEKQRVGTGYHEFYKGSFDGISHWKEDSLLIDDYTHIKLDLDSLFKSVIPTYSAFDEIKVNKEQWKDILEKAISIGGNVKECIEEANQWVQRVFEEYDIFTMIGV